MKRLLNGALDEHYVNNRQMVFLVGPRQSGKTWIARHQNGNLHYFSWDLPGDRQMILDNGPALVERAGLVQLSESPPLVVFDELHKYRGWKDFPKGFFDRWEGHCRVLVTGSAALDTISKGGDSLMGRYFTYHCHPLAWAEILADAPKDKDRGFEEKAWTNLLEMGGFPEPFLRGDKAFWRRWKNLRWKQLFREDLRDLTRSLELDRIEALGLLLL